MIVKEHELMELAGKVVRRYIIRGSVPFYEEEDFKMSIVEKFLQKQVRIEAGFQGKASRKTYIIAILNRMCCELIRKEVKHWQVCREINEYDTEMPVVHTSTEAIINDELKLLEHILTLFGEEKHKIRLFLCYFFGLPVRSSDVIAYSSGPYTEDVFWILNFGSTKSKDILFKNMALIVNLIEDKPVKSDAVRMWLMKVRNRIIDRLNAASHIARYDHDSVHALFERYYLKRSLRSEYVS